MATRKTLTVSLTPELEEFVASRVESGKFVSASEVVREGLRLLEDREARREAELARLRRDVRVGLDQARAGELVDGEEVFEELERRVATPNRDG
ncbi:MAG: type II toxin-antitoxin system ParD family antitoxin [Thermoanaerobaculia bacterium]